jgi:hypothetical protein
MTNVNYKGTFIFMDDPEGAAKCQRENPDTLVLQIHIIDPMGRHSRRQDLPDC